MKKIIFMFLMLLPVTAVVNAEAFKIVEKDIEPYALGFIDSDNILLKPHRGWFVRAINGEQRKLTGIKVYGRNSCYEEIVQFPYNHDKYRSVTVITSDIGV